MSESKYRTKFLLQLLMAGACLVAASLASIRTSQIREEANLLREAHTESLPPELAFSTVVLGGFRGILVDILWLRAIELQSNGQYFELVQLTDWISKLEPRFTTVWAYGAWNMAYNISVKMHEFPDRWQWVMRGIELLRDRGIKYNRNEPLLYYELSNILMNKMGGIQDQASPYYVNQWAKWWIEMLGNQTNIAVFAEAPKDLQTLLRIPEVARFAEALQRAGVPDYSRVFFEYQTGRQAPSDQVAHVLNSAEYVQGRTQFENFIRARRLREETKLDLDKMVEIDRIYGPLDWRVVQPYALYWAHQGLMVSPDKKSIQCERAIYSALQSIFKAGKLIVNEDGTVFPRPNLDNIEALDRYYQKIMEKYPQSTVGVIAGRRNFRRDAITLLYTLNQEAKAREFHERLRKDYPGSPDIDIAFETFVVKNFIREVEHGNREKSRGMILHTLEQAFSWLAAGDEDQFLGLVGLSKLIFNTYEQLRVNEDRVKMTPYPLLEQEALDAFFRSPKYPEYLKNRLYGMLQKTSPSASLKN